MLNKNTVTRLNVQTVKALNATTAVVRGKQTGNMGKYPNLPWGDATRRYLNATNGTIFCKPAVRDNVEGYYLITVDHEDPDFYDFLVNQEHLGLTWDSPTHITKQHGSCNMFAKFCLGARWVQAFEKSSVFIPMCPQEFRYYKNGTKLNQGESAENSVLYYLHKLVTAKTKQSLDESDVIYYHKLFSIKLYRDSKFFLTVGNPPTP